MKNKLIGLALVAAFAMASGSEVEAARRYKPRRARVRVFQRSSGDNFFGRIMEVERRKNAWLRATFLGR